MPVSSNIKKRISLSNFMWKDIDNNHEKINITYIF